MNQILTELHKRHLIKDVTNDEKLKKAIEQNRLFYIGFDPSFDSLHLGNYLMINTFNLLKKYGLKGVIVIGGATGMIGDPSGKSEERNLLNDEVVKTNAEAIKTQLNKLCDEPIIVNNFDFYKEMSFLSFLRDVGKLVNINYMLEKEIINTRLETGISYTEFSYNLIQGYDFLCLYNQFNVSIQIGGSDQWGNITTGIEMIRKKNGDANTATGLTLNLLTNKEGKKFGKSEKGAIYLDDKYTTAYEMYQFLFNQTDDEVEKLLYSLTNFSLEEIEQIISKHNENKKDRYAQKMLAMNIVSYIHGQEKYEQALRISKALFDSKLSELVDEEFLIAIKSLPTYHSSSTSIKFIDLLIEAKIVDSKRIARDLLKQNSFMLNEMVINDENHLVVKENAYMNKYFLIRKGKRNYFLVIF
ncbi:tyrosine--tRNA ligase [Ureaplasma canigenitalium]|uniref:tyrosine--tRNA ligase n=1 Tax=Ureaplasma canigenitalium TaxID=42092 RepID=UPI0006897850